MAQSYDSIESLINDLKEDVSTSMLAGEINKEVKRIYKEKVDEAYDSYSPTMYQRRYGNGGFGDEGNLLESVNVSGDGFELEITNEAKPVYNNNYRLDEIVEEGIYHYSPNPGARPVYANTQDELDGGLAESIIEKALSDWF